MMNDLPKSPASVFDVAEYILSKTGEITTMKLQKLLYYCQAWHLVWEGTPLFEDEIQAWANGPIVPVVYEAHKGTFKVGPGFFTEALKDPEVQNRVLTEMFRQIDTNDARLARRLEAFNATYGPETDADELETSTDERVAELMGYRDTSPLAVIINTPIEEGYACPIHQQTDIEDESLHWSEYNAFLWCAHCDYDWPSALCLSDPHKARKVFLDSVQGARARAVVEFPGTEL